MHTWVKLFLIYQLVPKLLQEWAIFLWPQDPKWAKFEGKPLKDLQLSRERKHDGWTDPKSNNNNNASCTRLRWAAA